MPKRATSTSYGGTKGNKPGGHVSHPNGGRGAFYKRMQYLADLGSRADRWEKVLTDPEAKAWEFYAAFDRAADRGYGKPSQAVEHSGPGGSDLNTAPQIWIFGDHKIAL